MASSTFSGATSASGADGAERELSLLETELVRALEECLGTLETESVLVRAILPASRSSCIKPAFRFRFE